MRLASIDGPGDRCGGLGSGLVLCALAELGNPDEHVVPELSESVLEVNQGVGVQVSLLSHLVAVLLKHSEFLNLNKQRLVVLGQGRNLLVQGLLFEVALGDLRGVGADAGDPGGQGGVLRLESRDSLLGVLEVQLQALKLTQRIVELLPDVGSLGAAISELNPQRVCFSLESLEAGCADGEFGLEIGLASIQDGDLRLERREGGHRALAILQLGIERVSLGSQSQNPCVFLGVILKKHGVLVLQLSNLRRKALARRRIGVNSLVQSQNLSFEGVCLLVQSHNSLVQLLNRDPGLR